jgi:hypothetical protein
MAEIKNTFLKSKMNKDLDDRLIPNGEYRDARNIAVGKSEDSDVGALENVIGNKKAANLKPYTDSFDIIGYYADDANNRIITFVTNYTDNYVNGHPTYASVANEGVAAGQELFNCHICVFNKNSNSYSKIVSGDFLNFSKSDSVLGVSLIEDLLFFTDNRNQPRKINIAKALNDNSYYSAEHNISVAKYSPFEPISLLKVAKHKPSAATSSGKTITFATASEISDVEVGMTVIARSAADNSGITGLEADNFVTVESIASGVVTTKKQSSGDPSFTLTVNDEVIFLKSTMSNEENNSQWPGDPKFMEEKFIRFSYRFKFDDGEYSLAAPFTQIAYVPKQKGYFLLGDEDSAFRSTIVDFMSNEINNVKLVLSLPTEGSKIISEYKIAEIDILYKESNSLIIKVLESIDASEISSSFSATNQYVYDYQSRKPFINLTQADVTRVYDKVPVKAFAQETSGNRIMYGNFHDKYTAPANIDYNVGVFNKDIINDYSFLEYPNHTVKQNRNYQVGFVLSDKFGRQSPVILSPIETGVTGSLIGGSTIYHSYPSSNPNVKNWFGDQVQVKVNKTIASGINGGQPDTNKGEPGLYALPIKAVSTADGFSIATASFLDAEHKQFQFTQPTNGPDGTGDNKSTNRPVAGSYLRGAKTDYVKVTGVSGSGTGYIVIADGAISDAYLKSTYVANDTHDIKFAYKINPIGWYSYKVVVKQSEQEYYNCYLPGVLNGYPTAHSASGSPTFPANENGKTAHVVLINDNINKIPRDLAEVGPEQKQYRSSVELFGRVENFYIAGATAIYTNKQYYPGRKFDLVSTIAQASELASEKDKITTPQNFYQLDTDPMIGRISTLSGGFGTLAANMTPKLAVYETKPMTSSLDIFWETSSVGLISDLNEDVLTGFTGAVGLTEINFDYSEAQDPNGSGTATGQDDSPWITDAFYPLSPEGEEMTSTGYLSALIGDVPSYTGPTFTVSNANSVDVTSRFTVYQDVTAGSADIGSYRIKISPTAANHYGPVPEESQFTFRISLYANDGEWTPEFTFQGSMQNESAALQQNVSGAADIPSGSQLENIKVASIRSGSTTTTIPRLNNVPDSVPYTHMTNGAISSQRLEDVGVFMTSKPQKRLASDPERFTINHSNTALSMTAHSYSSLVGGEEGLYGGQQVGHYDYTFAVKDAMANLGNSGYVSVDDTGTETANTTTSTYNQKIIITPDPIPYNLKTSCVTNSDDSSDPGQVFEVTTNYSVDTGGLGISETVIYYQWYIGGSTAPNRPSDASDWTGSMEFVEDDEGHTVPGGGSDAGVFRLGTSRFSTDVTDGTMQLDLMMEVEKTLASSTLHKGEVQWRVWRRNNTTTNSGSWDDTPTDTNGTVFQKGVWATAIAYGGNTTATKYSSVNKLLAFGMKGEYFIQAKITAKGYAKVNTWVNVNDANYPTCVPCFGKNLIEEATGDQDSVYFQYNYSTGSSDQTNNCSYSFSPTSSTGYARSPYPFLTTQIYEDLSFTTFKTIDKKQRAYDYKPGSSINNLTAQQVATLKSKRVAYFNNITQSSTTSATDSNSGSWKTNKFYVDTAQNKRIGIQSPLPGAITRVACDSASVNNKIQTYAFDEYTI